MAFVVSNLCTGCATGLPVEIEIALTVDRSDGHADRFRFLVEMEPVFQMFATYRDLKLHQRRPHLVDVPELVTTDGMR